MKYVALLRGINVGGNTKIRMADLKSSFEEAGFKNVTTYINSGNVIFDSSVSSDKLESKIEDLIVKNFKLEVTVMVRSLLQIQKTIEKAPKSWEKDDVRCYVAFLKPPAMYQQVMDAAQLKQGTDSLDPGPECVYMTTLLSGITKTGFTKLIGKPIYKSLTLRNQNTLLKVYDLMKKE